MGAWAVSPDPKHQKVTDKNLAGEMETQGSVVV